MSHVTYRIVRHDDGWAYMVNGVFSEPFPTHEAALAAARTAAAEQRMPGHSEVIDMRTRKATGIPRPLPAAIVRTPTSKIPIEQHARSAPGSSIA
jgi:hypothetical protein